jgi:hypothetical protein
VFGPRPALVLALVSLPLLLACPVGELVKGSEDETTTEGDGDGDGDPTGDGDGDPTGDGDGDPTGDGDGDGPVENTSLEVESDGMRIGYLMGVGEYTLNVWDDQQDLIFWINDLTGYIAGIGSVYYYTTEDCTGTRYWNSTVPVEACQDAPAPLRRYVRGQGGDATGFIEADTLETTTGTPQLIVYKSFSSNGNCAPFANNVAELCVLEVTTTNLLPTSFPLPIEVVEATP